MGRKFRNMADQLEYEYIQKIKSNKRKLFTVNNGNTISYILILNRGEQLFYQEGDWAFICEISAIHNVVISDSIKKWDSGEKVIRQEREQIKKNIEKFFMDNYKITIQFI